jgi:RNA polymerase sigma factor (sigma-70 family)
MTSIVSPRRVLLIDRIRETDRLAKEITMNRIEHVQHAHQVCALDKKLLTRGSFDSPAPPDLDASSLGKKSRLHREVRENGRRSTLRVTSCSIVWDCLPHARVESRRGGSHAGCYLRWHQSARRDIESPIAFLLTITTRLCLDRLRELKRQRAEYANPCPPELVVEDHMPFPEMQLEFGEEVSIGFLAVLERLCPEERAAFLLHDVLDYDYQEVGKILSKTESACRQMIHRARARLRDSRARFAVSQQSCERILKKFLAAIGAGDPRPGRDQGRAAQRLRILPRHARQAGEDPRRARAAPLHLPAWRESTLFAPRERAALAWTRC